MLKKCTATFFTRFLVLGSLLYGFCDASTCTKGAFGLRVEFECPVEGLMDSSLSYCCGPADNQYCCDLGGAIKDLGTGALVGIAIGAAVILGIILWAICCCCGCCPKICC